ncbi:MAG: glycosyltransferase family 2 protein [Candidatus Sericytochromatia bacterium]|nr:glycosyltransferase family 2 protein [Candidatus Sericytochromatia bacterium]
MFRVQILLSTYNGERYLADQLDSLIAQTHPDWRLLVRDDGSSDGTVAVLARYAAQDARIRYHVGPHLGIVGSYTALVEAAPAGEDAYAWCDQDDVWCEDKLARVALRWRDLPRDVPRLYCSRVTLVDAEMRVLGTSRAPTRPGLGNALVENVATGCTEVFNAPLRDLWLASRPTRALCHDWWTYLLASAFGEVHYDPTPSVLYRQHAGNAIGAAASGRERWRRRWRRWVREGPGAVRLAEQAAGLLEGCSERLTPSQRALVTAVAVSARTAPAMAWLAVDARVWRQSWTDSLVMRASFLVAVLLSPRASKAAC